MYLKKTPINNRTHLLFSTAKIVFYITAILVLTTRCASISYAQNSAPSEKVISAKSSKAQKTVVENNSIKKVSVDDTSKHNEIEHTEDLSQNESLNKKNKQVVTVADSTNVSSASNSARIPKTTGGGGQVGGKRTTTAEH